MLGWLKFIGAVLNWFKSQVKIDLGSSILKHEINIKDAQIHDLRQIIDGYDKKLSLTPKIYTTIESFKSNNDIYYKWVKELLTSAEYKYTLFDLRESTILEMTGCSETNKLIELNGRLNMLKIIDRYLEQGLFEYEDKIRRSKENS